MWHSMDGWKSHPFAPFAYFACQRVTHELPLLAVFMPCGPPDFSLVGTLVPACSDSAEGPAARLDGNCMFRRNSLLTVASMMKLRRQ